MRYDTEHGYLHCHRFWKPEPERVEALEDRANPKKEYGEELDRALRDIRGNWHVYRKRLGG